ncbi:CPBP family intramembrane glutamic endopeptidase [Actinoplanes sp. GCM10030250]|uniref:CPBP family intramembrane glutamic endopeptidase n=1 Tax=Actinoplanes sp. GCM10030250 TaxID=3273376 RepID=UPI00361E86FE
MIRRHPLASFFVLSFVIGWSPWPLHMAGVLPDTNFLPIAPLVAALIVAPIAHGRAGLRDIRSRMIRWRVPWYCYLAAVGVPLAVAFGTAGVNAGMGASAWSLSTIAWADVAVIFALRWINPLDGALAEEPSWRGYALPRLQAARTPVASATILGVIVAVWHIPLVFSGEGNPIGWLGVPTTFLVTFVYSWLFNRARGSALLTMLFHVVQGTITAGTFGYEDGADLNRMQWLGLAAWAVVAAAVLLDRPAWRAAPRDAVDPVERRTETEVLTTPVVQR